MIKVRLKDLLKKNNMTMTELHQKTGISQNALSLLANGKSNGIQFNTLEKIITITNSSIEDLLEYVGEQYTLSAKPITLDPIAGNPNVFDFKIIAEDLEGGFFSTNLSFRYSKETLNNRTTILISYEKSYSGFSNQLLNDFFYTAHNKGMLKIISFLVASEFFYIKKTLDLPLNSLVIFTWFGFTPSDKGEIIFSLPVKEINGITLPNADILNDEDFVEAVTYNEKNKLTIETYIK